MSLFTFTCIILPEEDLKFVVVDCDAKVMLKLLLEFMDPLLSVPNPNDLPPVLFFLAALSLLLLVLVILAKLHLHIESLLFLSFYLLFPSLLILNLLIKCGLDPLSLLTLPGLNHIKRRFRHWWIAMLSLKVWLLLLYHTCMMLLRGVRVQLLPDGLTVLFSHLLALLILFFYVLVKLCVELTTRLGNAMLL